MPNYLDIETWSRRDHYRRIRDFEKPFFNVATQVDVTPVFERCRGPEGPSFFLATLYLSLKAANATEQLRYRIRGDRVRVHDVIHAGSTILRDNETFCVGYFDYSPDFRLFQQQGLKVLGVARTGGILEPRREKDDVIHYSIIPWISFTSVSHPRPGGGEDSIPKIVFGKHFAEGSTRRMPVSVEVHHSLVDGLHVGRFLDRFQNELATAALD